MRHLKQNIELGFVIPDSEFGLDRRIGGGKRRNKVLLETLGGLGVEGVGGLFESVIRLQLADRLVNDLLPIL